MRRLLLPIALALSAVAPACASRTVDDSAASEQHVESSGDVQRDPVVDKLYEAPAVDNGQTGVDNWVLYAGLTGDGNGAFLAYGTNRDGLLVAIVHIDMATGRVSVFEKTSRDGTAETQIEAGPFMAYVHEADALLRGAQAQFAASNGGGARPQDLSRRASDCVLMGILAGWAVGGVLLSTVAVEVFSVPTLVVGGALVLASSIGLPGADAILTKGARTASAVFDEYAKLGNTVLSSAKNCATGEPAP